MKYRGTIHISVCCNAIGSWSVGVSVGGWELEHSQFSMSSSGREKRLRSGPAGLIMRKITYIIQTLWRGSNHSAKACSTHHSSLKRSEGRYHWASKATRAWFDRSGQMNIHCRVRILPFLTGTSQRLTLDAVVDLRCWRWPYRKVCRTGQNCRYIKRITLQSLVIFRYGWYTPCLPNICPVTPEVVVKVQWICLTPDFAREQRPYPCWWHEHILPCISAPACDLEYVHLWYLA